MKTTTLTTLLILITTNLISQNSFERAAERDYREPVFKKLKQVNNKLAGDTLWSEDFSGGFPNGWTTVSNSANNFDWQWDTVYRPGQFTTNTTKINSITNSNGFMLLPMDLYNTPTPSGGAVIMDTYFQSNAIAITPTPSVELKLQQFARFCCTGISKSVVQVSTDNFATFQEFDLTAYRAVRNSSVNAEFVTVNVSSVLANQDTAYLRFYTEGFSHYFWMIDDIALVEGNGQKFTDAHIFSSSAAQSSAYSKLLPTITPYNYLNNLTFEGQVQNITGSTLNGINIDVAVNHVQGVNGSSGVGQVFNTTQIGSNGGTLLATQIDTIVTSNSFNPNILGVYTVKLLTNSTQYPVYDSTNLQFIVSDTTFGRDFGNVSGNIGPANYVFGGTLGGTMDGDKLATLIPIDSNQTSIEFTSVSFYVSADSSNIGSVIRPVVWEFDINNATSTLSGAFIREVASSNATYTISANMLNTWQSFALDTGIAMNRNNNIGDYAVGWEMLSGTSNGSTFSVGNDVTAHTASQDVSNFVSISDGGPTSWGWVQSVPMIRLNIRPITVGLKEIGRAHNVSISPNPSNGLFNITTTESITEVNVFDLSGKLIQKELTNSQNQLDLSHQKDGIYFVRMQTESGEWICKKLVKN